jgi:hypothetical protein
MKRVNFQEDRNGGVMCRVITTSSIRDDGIVGFVDRSYRGRMPKAGETWDVEVTGQNRKNTVVFVRPVKKINPDVEAKIMFWINRAYGYFAKGHPESNKGAKHIGEVARRWVEAGRFEWGGSGYSNEAQFRAEVLEITESTNWDGNPAVK